MMKRTLDASCGLRVWRKTSAVCMDIDISKKPDVVGDFRAIPFRDETFSDIDWDPPHLVRNDVANWKKDYQRFGNWKSRSELESGIREAGLELWRVAVPYALLTVKMTVGTDRRVVHEEDLARLPMWVGGVKSRRPSKLPWSKCTVLFMEYQKSTY